MWTKTIVLQNNRKTLTNICWRVIFPFIITAAKQKRSTVMNWQSSSLIGYGNFSWCFKYRHVSALSQLTHSISFSSLQWGWILHRSSDSLCQWCSLQQVPSACSSGMYGRAVRPWPLSASNSALLWQHAAQCCRDAGHVWVWAFRSELCEHENCSAQ